MPDIIMYSTETVNNIKFEKISMFIVRKEAHNIITQKVEGLSIRPVLSFTAEMRLLFG